MSRIIGYARVSTSKEEQTEVTLPNQIIMIQYYAESQGLPVVIFEERKSGNLHVSERPKLREALTELRRGDIFYVTAEDRLARNMDLIGYLRVEIQHNKGAKLVCGDVTSYDDPMITLLAGAIRGVAAQSYRDSVSLKVRAAIDSRRKRLKVWGTYVPYGFVADQEDNLFISPEQQEVVTRIKTLSRQGCRLSAIVKTLNDEHIQLPIVSKTSRGVWYPTKVDKVAKEDYSQLYQDLVDKYGTNAFKPGYLTVDRIVPNHQPISVVDSPSLYDPVI